MKKVRLTKEQAALVPELQQTWTVFAGLTKEQQEVVRKFDGGLLTYADGEWLRGFYVCYSTERAFRIPADAEWEVVEPEPEFVDAGVTVINGWAGIENPNSKAFVWIASATNICGSNLAFHRFVYADGHENTTPVMWDGDAQTNVEYPVAVRFRRVKGGAE